MKRKTIAKAVTKSVIHTTVATNRCFSNAEDAFKAFRYFFNNVLVAKRLPEQLEVRHEGHCGRCGRTLTVPESIDRGIGPECVSIIGMYAPNRVAKTTSNVVTLSDRLHQHLHV